ENCWYVYRCSDVTHYLCDGQSYLEKNSLCCRCHPIICSRLYALYTDKNSHNRCLRRVFYYANVLFYESICTYEFLSRSITAHLYSIRIGWTVLWLRNSIQMDCILWWSRPGYNAGNCIST